MLDLTGLNIIVQTTKLGITNHFGASNGYYLSDYQTVPIRPNWTSLKGTRLWHENGSVYPILSVFLPCRHRTNIVGGHTFRQLITLAISDSSDDIDGYHSYRRHLLILSKGFFRFCPLFSEEGEKGEKFPLELRYFRVDSVEGKIFKFHFLFCRGGGGNTGSIFFVP